MLKSPICFYVPDHEIPFPFSDDETDDDSSYKQESSEYACSDDDVQDNSTCRDSTPENVTLKEKSQRTKTCTDEVPKTDRGNVTLPCSSSSQELPHMVCN
jgi:hypothetical protein